MAVIFSRQLFSLCFSFLVSLMMRGVIVTYAHCFKTYISGTDGFFKFENGCTMNTIIYKCVLNTHQKQRGPRAQVKEGGHYCNLEAVGSSDDTSKDKSIVFLSLFHISTPCTEDGWQRDTWTKSIYSQTQMLDGHISHILSDAACGFL